MSAHEPTPEVQPGPLARTVLHSPGALTYALLVWCRGDDERRAVARGLRRIAQALEDESEPE